MNETASVTARIPTKDKQRLDALAEATGRSKGFLISKAIRDYLENQAWQIEEIQKAIKEADTGEFATKREVEAFFGKWQMQSSLAPNCSEES